MLVVIQGAGVGDEGDDVISIITESEPPTVQPVVLPVMKGPDLIETIQHVEQAERESTDPYTFARQIALAQTGPEVMLVQSQGSQQRKFSGL